MNKKSWNLENCMPTFNYIMALSQKLLIDLREWRLRHGLWLFSFCFVIKFTCCTILDLERWSIITNASLSLVNTHIAKQWISTPYWHRARLFKWDSVRPFNAHHWNGRFVANANAYVEFHTREHAKWVSFIDLWLNILNCKRQIHTWPNSMRNTH